MTYFLKVHTREDELVVYWKLMTEGWDRFKADPLDPELDNIVEDLELLREATDWPMLRTLCTRALVLDMKLRHPLLIAADHREAL